MPGRQLHLTEAEIEKMISEGRGQGVGSMSMNTLFPHNDKIVNAGKPR